MIWSLRVPSGSTANETVAPEVYDITFTDVDADIKYMKELIETGPYPNSWFFGIWGEFASIYDWDGESCSEIACCVSYKAGNLSKIYVSNYAQGLASQYQANNRFGHTASRGAFMWFDYNFDGVPDHTARVYRIDSDGTIWTFEGNVGGMTTSRPYSPSDPTIYGYGYPNYDFDPAQEPDAPTGRFQPMAHVRHMRRLRGTK